jgi:hypothetical protein
MSASSNLVSILILFTPSIELKPLLEYNLTIPDKSELIIQEIMK